MNLIRVVKQIKTSHLMRISLLLAVFFGLDKAVAILRQVIIARQFGLSADLDAFNVANNLPDLLYAVISGGALAMAFIPILSEVLTKDGREAAWGLFSRVGNLSFLVTAAFSIVIALSADSLVRWELGIAPGFEDAHQDLVADLMRLNLIATLVFSISGLVMSGLQANQHFLLPAMAPLMYNFGQIFGALVLSPEKGVTLGPITLPAFGLGVHGLLYGVILGSVLHLGIQIPALFKNKFRWVPRLDVMDPNVLKVLRLLGPRLVTILLVQFTFLLRDNLASRLDTGSVSALTYGWMIQQVPETLIGTAIGTALLPSLAALFAKKDDTGFQQTVDRAVQVLLGLTIPIAAILAVGLRPLLSFAFGFDAADTDLLIWTTRGYLIGLIGHSLLEVAARSFYARQNALVPMAAAVVNFAIYLIAGSMLYRVLGAPGISLTDSIAYSIQAVVLLFILWYGKSISLTIGGTLMRAVIGAALAIGAILAFQQIEGGLPILVSGVLALGLGGIVVLPFIWRDLRVLLRL